MKSIRTFTLRLGLLSVLAAGCGGAPSPATEPTQGAAPSPTSAASTGDPITCRPAQGETATIATAKLIIEYNATDGDIGVHGAFDDHGWSELCVYDPNGAQEAGGQAPGAVERPHDGRHLL